MIESYPDPDEIEAYADRFDLDPGDVVRDIARLAAIAHLCEKGFLNEDCVLVGGMALRLRGSGRFTIFDTDTSLRQPPLDEIELTADLTLTTDDLEIRPADGSYWERRSRLTIAQPIAYSAYFASVDPGEPLEDEFSFTVNERGLNLAAEWFPLNSPYPGLAFAPVEVPVMQLVEQAAEKAVAWAAASLAKHYLDLGWITRSFHSELEPEELRRQCAAKLKTGRGNHSSAYEDLPDVASLRGPLLDPVGYFGPLNRENDLHTDRVRFTTETMTLDEAKEEIARHFVPLLFD